MISRCSAKNGSGWKTYGSRGIKVCDRWLRFEDFLADMGLAPPGLEIDRKDNDGDYEPSNCRWATRAEQMSNRSNHKLITAFGETLNIAEWARRTGLKYRTIHRRIHAGWAGEKALSTAGCEVTNA
jgi:hypothetical protein